MAQDLGVTSRGGLLRRLPANASLEQQIAAINNVFQQLNTWNGVVVLTGTTTLGSAGDSITTKTIAHNLGFKPTVQAFLNDASISFIDNGGHTNIPLPAWLGLDINSAVSGGVVQTAFIDVMVDATNVYFNLYNATGSAIGDLDITYYLMRLNTAAALPVDPAA